MTLAEALNNLIGFDPERRCSKCGGEEVGTSFERNAHCHDKTCPVGNALSREPLCCSDQASHMHRWCRRCHYRWAEACLDADVVEGDES